jgi:hypothetical protein
VSLVHGHLGQPYPVPNPIEPLQKLVRLKLEGRLPRSPRSPSCPLKTPLSPAGFSFWEERRDALRVRGLALHSFQNGIVGVRVPGATAPSRSAGAKRSSPRDPPQGGALSNWSMAKARWNRLSGPRRHPIPALLLREVTIPLPRSTPPFPAADGIYPSHHFTPTPCRPPPASCTHAVL